MEEKNNDPQRNYSKFSDNVINLNFLVEFLRETQQSIEDVAKKMNVTRPTIYYYFKKDDCSIENLIKIFDAYDCKIEFELKKEKPESKSFAPTLVLDDSLYDSIDSKLKSHRDDRLYFLRKAMIKYGYTQNDLRLSLEKNGFIYTQPGVSHWFQADNMYISILYQCAMAMDMELVIKISKK